MSDTLQAALHAWAAASPGAGAVVAWLATRLLFVLGLGFVVLLVWQRGRLSPAFLTRAVLAALLASGVGLLLNGLLPDPRPYLVGHYPPLAPTSTDNGFPSDHVLTAVLLAGLALWLDRRMALLLGMGSLLIGLARLATGAHHTLDVLGSFAIAALALGVAALVPLPAGWRRPLWPRRPAHPR